MKFWAHLLQTHRCPQGANNVSFFAEKHTIHPLLSSRGIGRINISSFACGWMLGCLRITWVSSCLAGNRGSLIECLTPGFLANLSIVSHSFYHWRSFLSSVTSISRYNEWHPTIKFIRKGMLTKNMTVISVKRTLSSYFGFRYIISRTR